MEQTGFCLLPGVGLYHDSCRDLRSAPSGCSVCASPARRAWFLESGVCLVLAMAGLYPVLVVKTKCDKSSVLSKCVTACQPKWDRSHQLPGLSEDPVREGGVWDWHGVFSLLLSCLVPGQLPLEGLGDGRKGLADAVWLGGGSFLCRRKLLPLQAVGVVGLCCGASCCWLSRDIMCGEKKGSGVPASWF